MKASYLLVSSLLAVTALAAPALADGFRCEGQGFYVQMYNQTQPNQGTRNPAVLVLASQLKGTLGVFRAPGEIRKVLGPQTVTFQGMARNPVTGNVVSMELNVERIPIDMSGQPRHRAVVNYSQDGVTQGQFDVLCFHYLKWPPHLW